MARWQLTEPHYLNVPGTKWEYKETDRNTGKQKTATLPVPSYLDPRDPGDFNYSEKSGGFQAEQGFQVYDSFGIVVCYAGKGQGRDIIFEGPPTPGMLPLDKEAQEITNKHKGSWNHPIEDLPGSYSDSLLADLQGQLADAMSKAPQKSDDKIDRLVEAMAMMADQNSKLISALSSRRV